MSRIWAVGRRGELVDVEDRHLARWREIADDCRAWMDFPYFAHEAPAEARQRRLQTYGVEWATVVTRAAPDADVGYAMPLELALEDARGELLAGAELIGSTCPVNGDIAVVAAVAVHPDSRERGVGTDVIDALVRYAGSIGIEHVLAAVCPGNEASLRLMAKIGWPKVGTDRCERNHTVYPAECSGEGPLFCSYSHPRV